MKIISTVLQSAKRSLKGEEKLWVVFWLWGVALYWGSVLFGIAVFLTAASRSYFGQFVGWMGLVLVFIYPLMFCFSLLRCSKNAANKWNNYGTKFYALIVFPVMHYFLLFWIGMASMSLIEANFRRLTL